MPVYTAFVTLRPNATSVRLISAKLVISTANTIAVVLKSVAISECV